MKEKLEICGERGEKGYGRAGGDTTTQRSRNTVPAMQFTVQKKGHRCLFLKQLVPLILINRKITPHINPPQNAEDVFEPIDVQITTQNARNMKNQGIRIAFDDQNSSTNSMIGKIQSEDLRSVLVNMIRA